MPEETQKAAKAGLQAHAERMGHFEFVRRPSHFLGSWNLISVVI